MDFARVFGLVAALVDASGTLIIVLAVAVCLYQWLRAGASADAADRLRLTLAQSLVFALSFKTGAGLIRTITVGTWAQFVPVLLIIAIRFFLGRTLKADLTRAARNG